MTVILQNELLDFSEITETIRSMLSSVDLNGPSTLSDSSLAIWATIMNMHMHVNPSLGLDAAKQISGWLRGAWTIGMATRRSIS